MLPPPWLIEDLEKQKQEREQERPRIQLDIQAPPPSKPDLPAPGASEQAVRPAPPA